jgi:hypothetical protein
MTTYNAHSAQRVEKVRAGQARVEGMTLEQIRHRMFACSTFLAFNFLFFLGVRPTLGWMSTPVQNSLSWLAVLVSSLWLYQIWKQRSEHYSRKRSAPRFRRQLQKLPLELSQVLGDRAIEQLSPQDLALLANVLPDFSRQYQLQVYQGVLQKALTSGNTESSCSLEVLHQLRQQLGLTDQDHRAVLARLGIEDVDRLNPDQQRTYENQARLTDYQTALELMLLEFVESGMPLQQSLQLKYPQILVLQQTYQISDREHAEILDTLLTDKRSLLQKAESLLTQLQESTQGSQRDLRRPLARRATQSPQSNQTQQQLVTKLLSILEILGEDQTAIAIARRVSKLASHIIPGLLARAEQQVSWQSRISPKVLSALRPRKLRQQAIQYDRIV